jgi:hypothetical protein
LLTGDLVRARRRGAAIVPAYLDAAAKARLEPVARYYDDTLATLVGATRDDVTAALGALEIPARDRVAALGVKKLLEDHAEFEVLDGADPEELRADVFDVAARAHKTLDVRGAFDRAAVLAEVAARRGTTAAALDARLFADLRGSEVLKTYARTKPDDLLARYNLALAQGVLLRATKVVVRVEGEKPARMKRIFRAARFRGLLHVVKRDGDATVIELDGPLSLFGAVQRYGLQLALFLPTVLACARFHVACELLWGKEREAATFEITPEQGLAAPADDEPGTAPDLDAFRAAFTRLESGWRVRACDRVFALPGEVVCVPDLVFEHAETGEEVYLESFGFWSRDAVWARVELLRKGAPIPVILAVSKHLRVSEEVLGDDDAGELYVYANVPSPRGVLERLERRRASGLAPAKPRMRR